MTPESQIPQRLGGGRNELADMWERMVAGGVPKERATRVLQGFQVDPADPSAGVDMESWRGLLSSALQGATLGLSDEFGAALRSLPALVPGGRTFGEAYSENVGAAREGLGQFREEHPVASFGAEVAGGLATGGTGALRSAGAAGTRAAGRTLTRQALRQPIARGAVEGAVAGAGAAEGDVGERIIGGVGGGALGAITGGAVQLGSAVRGPRSRATSRLAGALEREGVTDVEVATRRLRGPETLMDVGEVGGPVQRLARAAQAIPSEGSEQIRRTIVERAAQAPARAMKGVQREAKLSFEDAVQTVDQMAAERASAAQPLYRQAFQYDVSDDVVRDLFSEPEFRQAYEAARQIAGREVRTRELLERTGQEVPPDLENAVTLPELFRLNDQGELEFLTKSVPVAALDYMKKGLDAVIERGLGGQTLARRDASLLRRQLNAFLGRIDELVPEYGAARAAWAGPSRAMELFEAGRTGSKELGLRRFTLEDPRRIAQKLKEMTPSEREFYRRGALDDLRSQMGRAAERGRRDISSVLIGKGEQAGDAAQRLRALFENEADYMRFVDDMLRERRMAQGGNFMLGNSQTARIQEDVRDLTQPRFRLGDITRPVQATGRLLDRVIASRARAGGERTVDALAPLLTAGGPEAGRMTGEALQELIRRDALRRARLDRLTAGATVPAGLLAGRVASDESGRR